MQDGILFAIIAADYTANILLTQIRLRAGLVFANLCDGVFRRLEPIAILTIIESTLTESIQRGIFAPSSRNKFFGAVPPLCQS